MHRAFARDHDFPSRVVDASGLDPAALERRVERGLREGRFLL